MIKLIASDVDGTLLPYGETKISDEALRVIDKLSDMGVLFVVASGRPYCELKHLFEPVMDKIALVCSDGALTVYHGKTLLEKQMDRDKAEELLSDVEKRDDCEFLVYGEFVAYMNPKEESYDQKIRKTCFNNVNVVNTFKNIGEDYLKIGIYNKKGISCVEDYFLSKWSKEFDVIYSANEWLEFTAKGVNKSIGINVIMEHFGITKEETVAFGDSYNDIGMFEAVGTSFAMERAKDKLKEIATATCENVEEKIKELFDGTI